MLARAPRQAPFSALFSQLKSLGERTGEAVGGAYALAARSILTRVERLEDLNAERRRAQRSPGSPSVQPGAAARPAQALPPPSPSPLK